MSRIDSTTDSGSRDRLRVAVVAAALEAGARGCLSGSTTADGLAAAFRQVGRGDVALLPDVTQAILTGLGGAHRSPGGPALSPREREVLAFVCAGLGNKEIAERVYLTRGADPIGG